MGYRHRYMYYLTGLPGLQTQIYLLLNRASRMDKIRILTRMAGKIPHGTSAYSPMAATKRTSTTIHAVAANGCSDNDSSNNHTADRNSSSSNIIPNALRPAANKRTREADA